MQRTLLIALATAVVAAGIATTATIVLTGDDDDPAVVSPSLSPSATTTVETSSPAPGSSPTSGPDDGPQATDAPDATDGPSATAPPGVTIRSAEDVNCDSDPALCSSTDRMTVTGDLLVEVSESPDPTNSSRPTITMDSEVRKPDTSGASVGDEVGSIHVEVVIENSSDDTFVFARREIVLEIFKEGRLYDSFSTNGSGFDMTPGSKMNGTFDRPITEDGAYSWRAKVWYYEKP